MLRIMYNDYMVLPPENERMGHVKENCRLLADINKDYTDYKKEIMSKRKNVDLNR